MESEEKIEHLQGVDGTGEDGNGGTEGDTSLASTTSVWDDTCSGIGSWLGSGTSRSSGGTVTSGSAGSTTGGSRARSGRARSGRAGSSGAGGSWAGSSRGTGSWGATTTGYSDGNTSLGADALEAGVGLRLITVRAGRPDAWTGSTVQLTSLGARALEVGGTASDRLDSCESY